MLWIATGLGAALSDAAKYVLQKDLTHSLDAITITWLSSAMSIPALLLATWIHGFPSVSWSLLFPFIVTAVVNVATRYAVVWLLVHNEVSAITPYLSLSPLFSLLPAFVFLGETPTMYGVIGIVLSVAGIYVVNGASFHFSWHTLGAIGVVVAWSFSNVTYKMGMQASSPFFFILLIQLTITLTYLAFIDLQPVQRAPKRVAALGAAASGKTILQWITVSLTLIGYALAIKSAYLVFVLLFSFTLLDESNAEQKVLGSCLIVAGISFVAILG